MADFEEDLDEFDDVTTTDRDMPPPEKAVLSQKDFESGETPNFSAIQSSRGQDDASESGDEVESYYAWYNMERNLASVYRFFSAKSHLIGNDDAEELFLQKYSEEVERADTLLEYILDRFDHTDPIFYPIEEPPEVGTGDDSTGLYIGMLQVSLETEKELTSLIRSIKETIEDSGSTQDIELIENLLADQEEKEGDLGELLGEFSSSDEDTYFDDEDTEEEDYESSDDDMLDEEDDKDIEEDEDDFDEENAE